MEKPSLIWKFAERMLLGAAAKDKVSILTFHRVLPEHDPLRPGEPSAETFDRLIHFLTNNFQIVRLDESVTEQVRGNGRYRIVITFDDGYADNVELAYPILKKYGVPATFFVASGMIDGGIMWNDLLMETFRNVRAPSIDLSEIGLGELHVSNLAEKRAAVMQIIRSIKYLPQETRDDTVDRIRNLAQAGPVSSPMMTRSQLQLLSCDSQNQIGGHTVTHPILSRLKVDEARQEIERGKKELEQITGLPVRCFAYPNGIPNKDYKRAHVNLVRDAGFTIAVSTSAGGAGVNSDPLQLPRFTPWDTQHARFGLRMLHMARRNGERA